MCAGELWYSFASWLFLHHVYDDLWLRVQFSSVCCGPHRHGIIHLLPIFGPVDLGLGLLYD